MPEINNVNQTKQGKESQLTRGNQLPIYKCGQGVKLWMTNNKLI